MSSFSDKPFAAPELERPREDARQHAVALAVEPRVDHPRERDVVVAGRAHSTITNRTAAAMAGVLDGARIRRAKRARAARTEPATAPSAGVRIACRGLGLGH